MKSYNYRNSKGFTLIELAIAMGIIGILVAIAVVTYNDKVLEARRAEGINTIISLQLQQETYRASNTSYGTLAQIGGTASSENGYYTMSVSNNTATSYTVTAVAQGNQTNDAEDATACTTLSLAYSAGTETKTPAVCWAN